MFKERQTVWLAGSGMTTGRTTWRSLLKIQMLRFVQHDGVQGLGDGLLEGVPQGIPPTLAASLSGTTQPSSSLGTAEVTHVKTTKPTANFLAQNA